MFTWNQFLFGFKIFFVKLFYSRKDNNDKIGNQGTYFKLLFRVEFHDAHELDGQIRLYMNELGTISEADCKYITEKTQTIAALLPEIDEKLTVYRKAGR